MLCERFHKNCPCRAGPRRRAEPDRSSGRIDQQTASIQDEERDMHKTRPIMLTGLLLALVALLGIMPSVAQDEVALTLLVPEIVRQTISDDVLDAFRAETGIRVVMTSTSETPVYSANGDIEAYLDQVDTYARQADVVAMTTSQLSVEATRAGLLLDIAPLVNTDAALDAGDFYPVMWESFQWDGGMWAMPVSGDPIVLIYTPEDFDAAGVPYPRPDWTIYDLERAIRDLTQFDENGLVSKVAFLDLGGFDLLMLSLAGSGVVDDFFIPAVPNFENAALEESLTVWTEMEREGLLTIGSGQTPVQNAGDFSLNAPMTIAQSLFVGASDILGVEKAQQIAVFPGGSAGIQVNAVAISAGTQQPEAAYELAKYISASPEFAQAFIGTLPARRSLQGVEVGGSDFGFFDVPAEFLPVLEDATANAISFADARFSSFIEVARDAMVRDGVDAPTALDSAEQKANDNLSAADARNTGDRFVVPAPAPEDVVAEGQIILRFGVQNFGTTLPRQEVWDELKASFEAQDPEVGLINVEGKLPIGGNTLDVMTESYDCFYVPANLVQGGDVSQLRSMDPLMASDFGFDPNDFVGNVLAQMQRDNQTYGYPLIVQPQVMYYHAPIFQANGAFPPYPGWNVADFEDALRTLKITADDPAPFSTNELGGSHLLTLIAAYGGVPLDFSTTPITVRYTDPVSVAAIRQVLDLARDGYLDFEALSDFSNLIALFLPDNTEWAMYSELLSFATLLSNAFGGDDGDEDNPYVLTTMPQGQQYAGLTYDLGGAYINADTQYAEACYRWISHIAASPSLFDGMPARRSIINSPELEAQENADTVNYYRGMDELMSQPNAILFPSIFGSGSVESVGDFFVQYWLIRAFDRYVLEDAVLETELEDAQLFATSYQECAAQVPPFDPNVDDDPQDYFQQFIDCATLVDPSVEGAFPNF
jgi:ABC-type glycerol-3-phosphate transport system substrate-binding protein